MTQVTYPGVYLQEKSSGVHTITGVATSITSFLGRATKGPMNKPVRCFGYGDYLRNFGPPHPQSDMAMSVKQFFDNGGTDCYIVRVSGSATKATINLPGYQDTAVLTVSAKSEGTWGAGLRLEVDYNTPTPDETFNMRVLLVDGEQPVEVEYHTGLTMDSTATRYAPTYLTANSELISVDAVAAAVPNEAGYSLSRRVVSSEATGTDSLKTLVNALIADASPSRSFRISVDDSPFKLVTLATLGANPLTEIQTAINNALSVLPAAPTVTATLAVAAASQQYLKITSNTAALRSVRIAPAEAFDISRALLLGPDAGGIEVTRWTKLRPRANGVTTVLNTAAAGTAVLDALAVLDQSKITGITIDGTSVPFSLVTGVATDKWYQNKAGASPVTNNNDGVREKLRIITSAVNAQVLLRYRAETYGNHLALIAKDGDADKVPVLAAQSADATAAAAFNAAFLPIVVRRYALVGGTDSAPTITSYVGNKVAQSGFYALDPVDLFNLMVIPRDTGVTDLSDIYGQASIYCNSRRAFLLMEPLSAWTSASNKAAVVQDASMVNDLRGKVIKDYSAVFYPDLVFNDRGTQRPIGPAGAMAGLFSRTDAERGVWKAPAGTEADFRGISGFRVKLTDSENGVLNKLGVNCLRNLPGGFVSWGARTMAGLDDLGSEWKYIPIRRLALFLQESLYRGTQWAVFEPNDEPLWAKLRLNIRAFMNGLFRQGAFQGGTPDEAFYVKCDKDTTTQNDRNLGIVNVEIGFAPLKPAEFVVITIQQMAGDLT